MPSQPAPAAGNDGAIYGAVCGVVAVVVVIDGALWAASRLTGNRPVPFGMTSTVKALQASPPTHVELVVAAVLALMVLIPLIWLGVWVALRVSGSQRKRSRDGERSRAWATRSQLRHLLVDDTGSGRVVLGDHIGGDL